MLLRNYYNLMAAMTLGKSSTDTSAFGDGHINARVNTGALFDFTNQLSSNALYAAGLGLGWAKMTASAYNNAEGTGAALVFGTGETAVTFEDYSLASIYTSLIKSSFTWGTPSYNSETKKWTNTMTFLLTNTGGSSVTLKEIGISMISAYSQYGVLIYREILSTPITIAAGGTVTVTQSFEYTMPA